MWRDDQLDKATYVVFHDQESKKPLNVGTIDIAQGQFGPYIMTPVPPFGGLTGAADGTGSVSGQKMGVHVPLNALDIQYGPMSWPVPAGKSSDQFSIHQYGDGSV